MTDALDTRRPSITIDSMIEGRLFFAQPEKGYRFNLDSIMLARSIEETGHAGLDLGAGCGIVGQIALFYGSASKFTAVELCHEMVECAQKSAALNHFSAEQYNVVEADVRQLPLPRQSFDLIVCNPPFFKLKGPPSPNEQRRLARHGAGESLADWLRAMALYLQPGGNGYLIFPAGELPLLLAAIAQGPLKIISLRFIHPFATEPANRVLVKMTSGHSGDSFLIKPPLITFLEQGRYTPEVLKMLGRL